MCSAFDLVLLKLIGGGTIGQNLKIIGGESYCWSGYLLDDI